MPGPRLRVSGPQGTIRRIRLLVQYDGAEFLGWQSQAQGPTVQDTLERALEAIVGHRVRIHGAGRTDTGVHAAAMPAHCDLQHSIPAERLPVALNHFLPPSISVLEADDAAPDFDARRHAIMRWYRYQVLCERMRRPLGPRAWHVWRPLDVSAMTEALELLRGEHDFSGFRSAHCQSRRSVLTLQGAELTRAGELLAFDFKCRSFLHHMVRFMVGTVVAVGQGLLDRERLLRILDHGERPQLSLCAPPEGLCLMAVGYDEAERESILSARPQPPSF